MGGCKRQTLDVWRIWVRRERSTWSVKRFSVFDPASAEWAWMGGSDLTCESDGCTSAGVYGTLGVPAAGNIPTGRQFPIGWVDGAGNFWLFGGGADDLNTGVNVTLNDLWEYNPSTNEWAWMGGSDAWPTEMTLAGEACMGLSGTPAASNFPGSRSMAVGWTDANGNFWLLGDVVKTEATTASTRPATLVNLTIFGSSTLALKNGRGWRGAIMSTRPACMVHWASPVHNRFRAPERMQ